MTDSFNKLEEEINHLFNKVSSVSFSSLKKKNSTANQTLNILKHVP